MTDKMKLFCDELKKNLGDSVIYEDEMMSGHTTFKVGGPADIFVIPDSIESVKKVVSYCKEREVEWFVIGRGSNLLVKDGGFRGVIICLYNTLNQITVENETTIRAGAGALLSKIAMTAADNDLSGFEFASGIPGSLGGAIAMNAGAYGGEIKNCIRSALVIDDDMNIVTLSAKELNLGYRTSIIKEKNYVVLEASFSFEKGNKEEIIDKMNSLNAKRREKQPLEYPSAGSTFKRPKGHFAGKLIQDCDLGGYRVGGASISLKHCGFVVNDNNASAAEILQVIQDAKKTVYEKFGVELEPEVRIIGE